MTLADIADSYQYRFKPESVVDRLRAAITREETKLLYDQRPKLLQKWRNELRDLGASEG